MEHYINIQIKPDAEFPENILLNKAITKLHKALHDLNQTQIGVSFPDCTKQAKKGDVCFDYAQQNCFIGKLGKVIRLHGNQDDLQVLQDSNWLGGLSGYCEVGEILPVPEKIEGYRTISRKQHTMTLKKLEKRIAYQKANGALKTDEDVKQYERQYKEKMLSSSFDNPYLELQSASNGNRYRIFIEISESLDSGVSGKFNHFGLSKTATVPWF